MISSDDVVAVAAAAAVFDVVVNNMGAAWLLLADGCPTNFLGANDGLNATPDLPADLPSFFAAAMILFRSSSMIDEIFAKKFYHSNGF